MPQFINFPGNTAPSQGITGSRAHKNPNHFAYLQPFANKL
jgi:hypothetical protein